MDEPIHGQLTGVDGVVKWFDAKKGYGFIVGPEGQDIFVHYSRIEGQGYRSLRDGAAVNYDATLTDKGWQATRVARKVGVEVMVGRRERRPRSPRR